LQGILVTSYQTFLRMEGGKRPMVRPTAIFALAVILARATAGISAEQPKLGGEVQTQLHQILRDAHDEVKKHYYDPKNHGLDWDARYHEYDARISNVHSLGEGFRVVAAFLSGLKDSHVFFVPPDRVNRFEPGYRMSLIGDSCFVTRVRPRTDAESKLHVGDQIVHLNGFDVNRADFEDVQYYFGLLAPQPAVQLDLRSPAGEERHVTVNAILRPTKKTVDLTQDDDAMDLIRRSEKAELINRHRTNEVGDAMVWKMPEFDLDQEDVDRYMGIARRHKALILDLRGNPGGALDTLKWMLGSLFDHPVKIGDQVGRKESKELIAKPIGKPFDGKLIVLVDGGSASSSELFARVIQLEHRGTVIGDRTAGAVMGALHYLDSQGVETKIFYEFSITEMNLIMTDGKSLEKSGVVPDQVILPTGADLAAGRDPVLAHAAKLADADLDPVDAGKMFPIEWMPL